MSGFWKSKGATVSVGRLENNFLLEFPNSLFIAEPHCVCVRARSPRLRPCRGPHLSPAAAHTPGGTLGFCIMSFTMPNARPNLDKPTVGRKVWLLQGPPERQEDTARNWEA